MRILIADDDQATRLMLREILQEKGEVELAADGDAARQCFVSAMDEGKPFDLVCLDIVMPELNGQEALKSIRQAERDRKVKPGSEAKVVMITACGDVENVCDAFFGGLADGYVEKPLSIAALHAELKKLGL